MKIAALTLDEIRDSRGKPTIAVSLRADGVEGTASIPSGESAGSHEAEVFVPTDARRAISEIQEVIGDKDFHTNTELDLFLIAKDGTPRKEKLGGNVMLGVSLAFARARAAAEEKELWEMLRAEYFPKLSGNPAPRIFANFIEGGAHAKNNLALQEYLVVAKPYPSVSESIAALKELHAMLGKMLAMRYPAKKITIGHEGGYAADFRDDLEPLEVLSELLNASRHERAWFLGLDAAASTFFRGGTYYLRNEELTPAMLAERYAAYAAAVPLLATLEDPFGEDAVDDFAAFQQKFPDLMVIGDDLTVTDPARIEAYAKRGAMKGVIVKPNQIGTVTEACEAMVAAAGANVNIIVSHRAGETTDPFLVHFARAGNAYGVKIGAPVGDRLPRYEELARLYTE